ncbi:MAG: hypothetical protein HY901_25565 [Deltaproteobacteria bacterium]|nr:hypothetical protein [Deltaproteobacteria bacterium]
MRTSLMGLRRWMDPPTTRRDRGQTLVLTAVIMLFVVVAVYVTFVIGHRTREKVKMQAMADAGAYSLAVAEARAFNFYAWSNRAIIAHYVSILSVHAHASYLTWYDHLLLDTSRNYVSGTMIAILTTACICSKLPCTPKTPCGCICKPCSTACSALNKVRQISNMYKNDTFGHQWVHDKLFNNMAKLMNMGAESHWGMAGYLRIQQKTIVQGWLLAQMAGQRLAKSNAQVIDSRIDATMPPSMVNIGYYRGAVDDDPTKQEDKDYYHEILAGTRWPGWITARGFTWPAWWAVLLGKAQMKAMPDTTYTNVSNEGNAKVLKSGGGFGSVQSGIHRSDYGGPKGAGAEDHGSATTYYFLFICPCSPGVGRESQRNGVYSDPDDVTHYTHHSPSSTSIGAKLGRCTSGAGDCGIYQGFMAYKGDESEDSLWGMPRTYAVVTKPMNQRYVWDFNFSAEVVRDVKFTTTNSGGDSATGGNMAAQAGGLVYFHKPGGWGENYKEPPNLWNPFWRAKLHPISRSDAQRGLMGTESGNVLMALPNALHY